MRCYVCLLWLLLGAVPFAAGASTWNLVFPAGPQWATYFYFHKETEQLPGFVDYVHTSRVLESEKQNRSPPIEAFLSVVFAAHPDKVPAWVSQLKARTDYSRRTRSLIARALWLSGNPEEIGAFLDGETPEWARESISPDALLQDPILNREGIDRMWGAFMGSGDARYVKRVIDVLETGTYPSFQQHIIWALASNMHHHETVRRIVMQEMETRPEAVRTLLDNARRVFENGVRLLEHRNGLFSGEVWISDLDSQANDGNPGAGQTPARFPKRRAKRGETIAVNVLFSGMELDARLQADVTFNLRILTPEGALYGNHHMKDAPALLRRLPFRFATFPNEQFPTITFRNEDPPGTYTFEVTLHDNIGEKTLVMQETVTLEE